MAVAIGIAWGGSSSSSSSTNDKKKKTDEQHHDDTNNEHEFDLISRRLVYDEFFDIGIGLVPTIDDDDEEENTQEQEQQEKVEKEVLSELAVTYCSNCHQILGTTQKPLKLNINFTEYFYIQMKLPQVHSVPL